MARATAATDGNSGDSNFDWVTATAATVTAATAIATAAAATAATATTTATAATATATTTTASWLERSYGRTKPCMDLSRYRDFATKT